MVLADIHVRRPFAPDGLHPWKQRANQRRRDVGSSEVAVKDVGSLFTNGALESNEEAGDVPAPTLFDRSEPDAGGVQLLFEAAARIEGKNRDNVAPLPEGTGEHDQLALGTTVCKVVGEERDPEAPRHT